MGTELKLKPPCPQCGSQSVFHGPEMHTFARRRAVVKSRQESERLIHELLTVFPDLESLHALACKRKGAR